MRIGSELLGLFENLNNGLRLLFFRRVPIGRYYVSFDQAVLLVGFYSVVVFLGSLYLSLPKPEFNEYGIMNMVLQVFFLLMAVYIVAKITRRDNSKLYLFIIVISTWPWLFLVWLIVGGSSNFDYWQFQEDNRFVYCVYNIWSAILFSFAIGQVIQLKKKKVISVLSVYMVVIAFPVHYLASADFWYASYDKPVSQEKSIPFDVEETYYGQFQRLKDLNKSLLPERANVPDLYFIGFAGDASQDVFMKEVQYARDLFDTRFDTHGRSVALINNRSTVANLPIASISNLRTAIRMIGERINPDEDILFVYLTSHGSENHRLSVKFSPMHLNSLTPKQFRVMLDRSGIKFRILVVSACYSGGFIKDLENENTIVFTASAADRNSFGCSNGNDFTYMGQALFDEQLKSSHSFIRAFRNAIASIQQRETTEGRKPSMPQLVIGKNIEAKLKTLVHGGPI